MSITWASVDNVNLTDNKIRCGYEASGTPVFVAQAKDPQDSEHSTGLYPGKYSINIAGTGGAAIAVKGKEIEITDKTKYQVATADEDDYKWVSCSGKFKLKHLNGDHPFVAGYEISDEGYGFKIYYIARAKVVVNDKTSDACGKVYVGGTAKIPYGWEELSFDTYDVLVHNTDKA